MIRPVLGRDALRGAASFVLAGLLTGAAPVAVPPAATSSVGTLPDLGPQTTVTRLASGGLGIVRPLAGAPVAAVELWFRAPSTGFGTKPAVSIARVAAQVVAASKPFVGSSLGEQVRDLGGRLEITVYADSLSISATVPSASAAAVLKAMTTDYFAPVVTNDGFDAAQQQVNQEAFFAAFDPQTVVRDAVFGQLFATGPQHFSAEGSTSDIGALSLDAVRGFASRAFRANNAVVVVSGAVDPAIVASAVPGRPDAAAGVEPFDNPVLALAPGPVTQAFAEPSGGYGWVGPAIADARAATALDFVSDYLFRPEVGSVVRELADRSPDAFVNGQFITLNDPGVMVVVFSGKKPAELRLRVDAAIAAMQQPLDAASFARAIAAFKGHLLSDLQTPRQLADNFGWYAVEGAPEYAPGADGDAGLYFKTASALTPAFVAETVRSYLGKTPIVVTLAPGTAASARPGIGRRFPLRRPSPGGSPAPGTSPAPAVPAPEASPTAPPSPAATP